MSPMCHIPHPHVPGQVNSSLKLRDWLTKKASDYNPEAEDVPRDVLRDVLQWHTWLPGEWRGGAGKVQEGKEIWRKYPL